MATIFTRYYPIVLALAFLVVFVPIKIPAKGSFLLRALLALLIATALAHVNRWFEIWPEYRYFPSGHMTFCLGVSISLGMLRPWTLAINLPILIPFGVALVVFRFHSVIDILGAIPLVLIVYGVVHWYWQVPFARPPLDMAADSP